MKLFGIKVTVKRLVPARIMALEDRVEHLINSLVDSRNTITRLRGEMDDLTNQYNEMRGVYRWTSMI